MKYFMNQTRRIRLMSALLLAVLLLQLSGCTSNKLEALEEKYPEWSAAVLADWQTIELDEVTAGDRVSLSFTHVNASAESFEEFTALAEAHNEILESNPNYFVEGERFAFEGIVGETVRIAYLSDINACEDLSCEWDEFMFGARRGVSIRYLYIAHSGIPDCMYDGTVSVSIPVLVLDLGTDPGIADYEKYFAFLQCFVDLETVVINYNSDDASTEMVDAIHAYQPNVEVIRTSDYVFVEKFTP